MESDGRKVTQLQVRKEEHIQPQGEPEGREEGTLLPQGRGTECTLTCLFGEIRTVMGDISEISVCVSV